jgi:hypothetical protein
MLLLSLVLLLIAALLGTALAVLHLLARPPGWAPGALHGLLGLAGFGVLVLALRGPPRGQALGVAEFGRIAAVLLGVALLAGAVVLATLLRYRRVPGLVIGLHATIAVSGVVILAAYTLVG